MAPSPRMESVAATVPWNFWAVPEEAPVRNDPAFGGDDRVYRKEHNAWKSRESYRRSYRFRPGGRTAPAVSRRSCITSSRLSSAIFHDFSEVSEENSWCYFFSNVSKTFLKMFNNFHCEISENLRM